MSSESKDLVAFIQEHCLWQFASRATDREENINGVLSALSEILTGGSPKLETPMDRLHFANANHLALKVKGAFPWLGVIPREDIQGVVSGAITRIQELTVKDSLNGELRLPTY
jgi:hypothetical protein